MLILTRKPSEEIVVLPGDAPITIRINSVRGDKVRIGLDGDGSAFYRAELLTKNDDSNEDAK